MSLCVGNGQVAVLTIQLYYLTAVPVSPDNICYLDNIGYVTSTHKQVGADMCQVQGSFPVFFLALVIAACHLTVTACFLLVDFWFLLLAIWPLLLLIYYLLFTIYYL